MFNPAKTYTHPSLQPSNKSSVLLQETFWHQGRQYKGVMTKAEYIHSLAQVFSSSPADTLDLDKCLQRGLLCTLQQVQQRPWPHEMPAAPHPAHQFSALTTRNVFVLSRSVMSDSLRPHGLQPTRLLCPWGFSRLEYQSGLPCPPPRHLPNPGIEPRSPALHADSLLSEPPGSLDTAICPWGRKIQAR